VEVCGWWEELRGVGEKRDNKFADLSLKKGRGWVSTGNLVHASQNTGEATRKIPVKNEVRISPKGTSSRKEGERMDRTLKIADLRSGRKRITFRGAAEKRSKAIC